MFSHNEANEEIMHFCRSFQDLYGPEYVTPNMHSHSHIQECILNYGPVDSFWVFSFERFHGIWGNQPSNQQAVEVQLMRRFLKDGLMFSDHLIGNLDAD